jgi:hypothetical protein
MKLYDYIIEIKLVRDIDDGCLERSWNLCRVNDHEFKDLLVYTKWVKVRLVLNCW